MDAKRLIELRKQAEKSVADMPDGDLKLKAFEVILNHLVVSGEGIASTPVTAKHARKAKDEKTEDVNADTTAGRIPTGRRFFQKPKIDWASP
jgi:hypothetical protein